MTKNTNFPREHIASQISDLRQMRYALADLQGVAYRLLTLAQTDGTPPVLSEEVRVALLAMDRADEIANERIQELRETPTQAAEQIKGCSI